MIMMMSMIKMMMVAFAMHGERAFIFFFGYYFKAKKKILKLQQMYSVCILQDNRD